MTIDVAIEHVTTYDFDRSVGLGPHIVRLRPAPHTRTPIKAYSLRIEPDVHFLNWQQDPFGNFQARLVFPEKTKRLKVVVDLVLDMTVINPFDFFLQEDAEHIPFTYDNALHEDLAPYLVARPATPLLREWLAAIDHTTERRTIDFLVDINQRLATGIEYSVRMEPGVQTPEETLQRSIGSCRDSAWLLVHILRHFGYAARFVSGYLVQLASDVESLEGPSGPATDFTDLHAWAEVFLPGAGWVGLDPTSGLFVGEGHVPLAATPTPATAAPISGALDEAEVEFSYSNQVVRVHEDPRVTQPYSPTQWGAIDALGHAIDERLADGDVRLTMGGEPTFVSIDDMESEQWKTLADGEDKRARATELTGRLRDRFGGGAVLHHGQGKWYPGEPLPRWQQAIIWRTDGVPLWNDQSLLTDPFTPGTTSGATAEAFARGLAEELCLGDATLIPAFEDPIHSLWEEAMLPEGPPPSSELDPTDPDLAAEAGRRRLTQRLDREAGRPRGWVLPLHQRTPDGAKWRTSRWVTRRSHLFLLPGDSPMGYRLPIASLGWSDIPPAFEPSSFAQLQPLPEPPVSALATGRRPTEIAIDDDAPPTALCVEERDGNLHVFLPPIQSVEAASALVAAIEGTATAIGTPVVIEGYPIPGDPRLQSLVVTPDPGVIEVNVPPARNWGELKEIAEGVAEEARNCRLGTETYDLDGTHNGTGGGNHVTLGGLTPADSPLLRRPSLLRSLITYWQHHPSLSYLFSGRFIGPSSQAPRVDEARDDNLYELETAFAELDRLGDDVAPWIVDRLLRHLLVDLTGNTHRSEFCIDKLFSPDGERGRLGLLELRAFEMPPHPQMALVQALLVRALVVRCWEDPYRRDPQRWGTMLHDRHLLPWFVERDLAEVVADLADHELEVEADWFGPFTEFRFPRHGTTTVAGVTMELRGAIEPWHVLGEETTGSGTARYVDSSVERVQLRLDGFADQRHMVTCNGVEVPLTATDVPGTFVAGIRFKAWDPVSGLHPTLGIDSPLTFDLVDRDSERSLGGFRYHVVHQGGLSYDSFPVNAVEAESRRQSRFEAMGHTPGRMVPQRTSVGDRREYPATLDLRRTKRS